MIIGLFLPLPPSLRWVDQNIVFKGPDFRDDDMIFLKPWHADKALLFATLLDQAKLVPW